MDTSVLLTAAGYIERPPREWIVKQIKRFGRIEQVCLNRCSYARNDDVVTGARVHFSLRDNQTFTTYFPSMEEAREWLKAHVIYSISPEVPLDICGTDVGQATYNVAISSAVAFTAIVDEAIRLHEDPVPFLG